MFKVAKNTLNVWDANVDANLGEINFLSIKRLLRDRLEASVGLYRESLGMTAHSLAGNFEAIPLNQDRDDTQLVYVSAIALKLSAVWHQPAFDIASRLVKIFCSYEYGKPLLAFGSEVSPSGWIYFQVTDLYLAAWLQHWVMATQKVASESFAAQSLSPDFFPIQYTHARCCTLLRLGNQQGLLTIGNIPDLEVLEPQLIPWLDESQQFYLVHKAERRLIAQLSAVVDALATSTPPNWVKLIAAFESFYSSCRIFGEVKTEIPQLAQARLGLVGVVRSVVRSLLQNYLGVSAPTEL